MVSLTPSTQSPAAAQPAAPATLLLDVRPLLAAGTSPCQAIDEAASRVPDRGSLVLLVPFEPVPLYEKLLAQGFSHASEPLPGEGWRVTFRRDRPLAHPRSGPTVCGCPGGTAPLQSEPAVEATPVRIDARRLEPPQPMVRILEALDQLPGHGVLEAHTDRRPVHLLALLESRGCSADSKTQPDGSCITRIRRGATEPPTGSALAR